MEVDTPHYSTDEHDSEPQTESFSSNGSCGDEPSSYTEAMESVDAHLWN